ncbi:hypothetical protein C8R41DRAFT_868784 [Lentinula lateritia]|uniref:Uncharacterized protein n=1 Tax=Lentinula lateritia TaxID=40482 RepID=A0ABQ8V9G1_9AGAR|nr:hypothetical protein C8R41DRAFT_868784 [Lentinula lateritia]
MNHKKLNQLFKRDYIPDSGGSNDDYEPSQLFTPTKKCRCDEENSSLLPPCPSALASRNANEDLAHSGVFDNDVSPQEFIEQLCASKGINLTILQSADLKDGASDIDNEEFGVESQKQELYESSPPPSPSQALSAHPVYQINVDVHSVQLVEAKEQTSDFCPHLPTACPCAMWLHEQHLQLTQCIQQEREENDQLIATNFRQKVCLGRSQNTIRKMLELLDPSHLREYERLIGIETIKKEIEEELQAARMDVEKARAAQKDAEDRLEAAHTLRRDLLSLLQ